MRKKLLRCTGSLLSLVSMLSAQSVKLMDDPGFVSYATYYISSIDLSTGASDVQFFGFRMTEESGKYTSLEDPEYQVWASLEFEVSLLSRSLGITEPTTVIKMQTAPFQMKADLRISNTSLSIQTTSLFDMAVPPNEVPLTGRLIESIDISKFEDLLSTVVTTGKLADGNYTFRVLVRSGPSSDEGSLIVTDEVIETIVVTTPTSLNLLGPGGALADSSQNVIFSPYPIFQWETEPCSGCESYIRIAKFDSESHSSPEEAIQGVTTLPMDQTKGWEPVGFATNFQYPLSDAIDLEPGQTYVWQVQKKLPTTEGAESFTSPIFAFKLADLTDTPSAGFDVMHPVLQQLMELMGEGQFRAYFGPEGDLSGFDPSGTYVINGMEVSVDEVFRVLRQFSEGSTSIISIAVE